MGLLEREATGSQAMPTVQQRERDSGEGEGGGAEWELTSSLGSIWLFARPAALQNIFTIHAQTQQQGRT